MRDSPTGESCPPVTAMVRTQSGRPDLLFEIEVVDWR
jgi:hypothetical protein